MASPNTNSVSKPVVRVRLWYGLLLLVFAVFVVRLFYVQIIRYDHYKNAALSDQLKEYQIPANRGIISAHDGDTTVPIVLNQQLYTLYADPTFVTNPGKVANDIAPILKGQSSQYASLLKTKDTKYVILAKQITAAQETKILALKYPGVGAEAQDYRTYPQGSMASQLLGFVNNQGQGEYGVEQAENKQLSGTPGQLKAITDINGVPLAASHENTQVAPKNGDNLTLTIDLAMQQQLESILAQGVATAHGTGGSALIIDPNSGAVKAMANVPTYDPANYDKVTDPTVFQNGTVANSIEVGSVMKTLTTAAGIDQGVFNANTVYNDPGKWIVDGSPITNDNSGSGPRSINDIINLSLNTGATWELMQMGGGQINTKARDAWHDYLVNHYLFGQPTGIEQGYEASGYIPSPKDNGAGINLTYANTAFGQALTATPIQLAGALSSVLNGGTYYQPHLVDSTTDSAGNTANTKPVVRKNNVVDANASQSLRSIMEYDIAHHDGFSTAFDLSKYDLGGKTGTAQIADPKGGYLPNSYNGTYVGFVGGNNIQYVIVVFVTQPQVQYAGIGAAQPIYTSLAHMLINDSYVIPRH